MTPDQEAYRRAAGAALAGLVVQFALTIVVAIVGLAAESPAVHAATWHFLGGILIWTILVLLFHQHRLERAEALEAEQLSRADAATAALFEERADDLELARRRLRNLARWGLGGVSLALAIYLLVVGGLLLRMNYAQLRGTRLADAPFFTEALGGGVNTLVLMAVFVGTGLAAFLVARYIAGMTRSTQWQLLRGGASYIMGNALVAALLLLGAVFAHFELANLMAWLRLAIPGLMVLIGVEILATFLMNAYRPRVADEVPRPAFDSRVLGLLTTPESIAKAVSDTINYQFGFEVSRSWFYKLLGQAIVPLTIFATAVLVLASSVVIVAPHEQAVVTRFGRIVTDAPLEPGIHLKLPWPISSSTKLPVRRIQEISIGSIQQAQLRPGMPILWTNPHTEGDETYLITAAARSAEHGGNADRREQNAAGQPPTPGQEDASGPSMSLVAADITLYFRIEDLTRYLQSSHDPVELLKAVAERAVNAHFVTRNIDDLLTRHRVVKPGDEQEPLSIGEELQTSIAPDAAQMGIRVVGVFVAGIHPPQAGEVADSFHELIGAQQDRQSALEKANSKRIERLARTAGTPGHAMKIHEAIADYNKIVTEHGIGDARAGVVESRIDRLLIEADGDVAEKIYRARAYRWKEALTARTRAERFDADRSAAKAAPEYFRVKRLMSSVAAGMKDGRKVLLPTNTGHRTELRIDLSDQRSDLDQILKPK